MSLNLFRDGKLSVKQVARIPVCAALLVAAQFALVAIPNCELVSTLIVIFTLSLGWETLWIVWIFSLVEGLIYGFGTWVVGYICIWPVLVVLTMLFKGIIKEDFFFWGILTAVYAFIFGALFALEFIFIDRSYMIVYWIRGIPWDCFHGATNFVLMWTTGKVLNSVMKKCVNM